MSELTVINALERGIETPTGSIIERGRAVREKWGDLIERYCGDVPPALAYIRIAHESGGNPNAVSSQGEVGLLQLFPWASQQYGVNPRDPAENLWAGFQLWQKWSRALFESAPDAFAGPDSDFWGTANLTMSIGAGGTRALVRAAGGGLGVMVEFIRQEPGRFIAIVNGWYAGKPASQSQSPELVAARIGKTVSWIRAAGELGAVSSGGYGREIPREGVAVDLVDTVSFLVFLGALIGGLS